VSDYDLPPRVTAEDFKVRPHPYRAGHTAHDCVEMVMVPDEFGGHGDTCGKMADDPVHDDPRAGQDFDYKDQVDIRPDREFDGTPARDPYCTICAHRASAHHFAMQVRCSHCPNGICVPRDQAVQLELPGMWERSDFE
jgi:hypothetical protein